MILSTFNPGKKEFLVVGVLKGYHVERPELYWQLCLLHFPEDPFVLHPEFNEVSDSQDGDVEMAIR